jgi:hypothetical protein
LPKATEKLPEQTPDEYYALHEIKSAFDALSNADLTRIIEIARAYARSDLDYGDLLNEATIRIRDGDRKWPRNVKTLPFLSGVMRGIASEERRQPARRHKLHTEHADDVIISAFRRKETCLRTELSCSVSSSKKLAKCSRTNQ